MEKPFALVLQIAGEETKSSPPNLEIPATLWIEYQKLGGPTYINNTQTRTCLGRSISIRKGDVQKQVSAAFLCQGSEQNSQSVRDKHLDHKIKERYTSKGDEYTDEYIVIAVAVNRNQTEEQPHT